MYIIAPHLSCLIDLGIESTDTQDKLQAAIDEGYSQIYVNTFDGIFKHHVLEPGKDGMARFIRLPMKTIPGVVFKTLKPSINFLPAGKIPIDILHTIRSFFINVIKAKGTAVEAMIWILWNPTRGYFLHVPKQSVSRGSVSYEWDGLPKDALLVADVHSHADFAAFFSGTDDADDKNVVRFSGVIGNNTSPTPSMKWRFNYFDAKINLEVLDVFEQDPNTQVEIPEQWMKAVADIKPSKSVSHTPGHKDSPITSSTYSNGFPRSPSFGSSAHLGYGGYGDPELESKWTGSSIQPKTPKGKKKQFGKQKTTLVPPTRSEHNFLKGVQEHNFHAQGALGFPDSDAELEAEIEAQLEAQVAKHFTENNFVASEKGIVFLIEDLPMEYDYIAGNNGVTVANAYAAIEAASLELVDAADILRRSTENMFQLIPEEEKLAVFKSLVTLLPQEAITSLQQNGL